RRARRGRGAWPTGGRRSPGLGGGPGGWGAPSGRGASQRYPPPPPRHSVFRGFLGGRPSGGGGRAAAPTGTHPPSPPRRGRAATLDRLRAGPDHAPGRIRRPVGHAKAPRRPWGHLGATSRPGVASWHALGMPRAPHRMAAVVRTVGVVNLLILAHQLRLGA